MKQKTVKEILLDGWEKIGENDEGVMVFKKGTEELFYNTFENKVIGIFQTDLINELYEKAKAEKKKVY